MVEGLEGLDEDVLGEVANPDYPDAERRFWHPHRGVWWGFKSEWLLHGVCMWLRSLREIFHESECQSEGGSGILMRSR